MVWTAFLPVALFDVFGWSTPVVAGVVTFLLFGVENIGIQVTHPPQPQTMHADSRWLGELWSLSDLGAGRSLRACVLIVQGGALI
jgi:hypothetical protein